MATRIPPPDDPDSSVTYYEWRWGNDEARRPGLPWIGIFLVVFGGLLLLEQALPQYRGLGNVVILAAGIASLIAWAIRRGTLALYAGAFLTALAAPGTYESATGQDLGDGWGTFCFGLAFLFIAVVRAVRGGGWGWQLLWGGVLCLLGGVEITQPNVSGIALPLVIVGIGVLLLLGSRGGRGQYTP
jgi:hypothetical protein